LLFIPGPAFYEDSLSSLCPQTGLSHFQSESLKRIVYFGLLFSLLTCELGSHSATQARVRANFYINISSQCPVIFS
jgi:hypothetical protein